MNDYISLSTLNDFIFCPYSIYLHNVYMETADDMYKAVPQIEGMLSHQGVDNNTSTSIRLKIFEDWNRNMLFMLCIFSKVLP